MCPADARNGLLTGLCFSEDLNDLLLGERARLHLRCPLVAAILTDHVLLISGGMS